MNGSEASQARAATATKFIHVSRLCTLTLLQTGGISLTTNVQIYTAHIHAYIH